MATKTLGERAVHKWLKGEYWCNDRTPMWSSGDTLYSYNTAIAYRADGDDYIYVNVAHYTSSTAKHQATLRHVLREQAVPNRIIYVNMMPWRVRGEDLRYEADRINPIKWSQLNTMLLEGHTLSEDKLGHTMVRHYDPSLLHGCHEYCPQCGHYMHITPQYVSLHNDRYKAAHFRMWGGAVRYKCSKRLVIAAAQRVEEYA